MGNPKADCEALMNSVLPFAEQMLITHGEFIPFGGAMRPNGQFIPIIGYAGNEHPKSIDVIDNIKREFIVAARKREYKATAIVCDMRVKLPSNDEISDAIAISLDHSDRYSVIVLFPYKIDAGKLTLGTVFAQKGDADIFPA